MSKDKIKWYLMPLQGSDIKRTRRAEYKGLLMFVACNRFSYHWYWSVERDSYPRTVIDSGKEFSVTVAKRLAEEAAEKYLLNNQVEVCSYV